MKDDQSTITLIKNACFFSQKILIFFSSKKKDEPPTQQRVTTQQRRTTNPAKCLNNAITGEMPTQQTYTTHQTTWSDPASRTTPPTKRYGATQPDSIPWESHSIPDQFLLVFHMEQHQCTLPHPLQRSVSFWVPHGAAPVYITPPPSTISFFLCSTWSSTSVQYPTPFNDQFLLGFHMKQH
jgi:hypothetical protein